MTKGELPGWNGQPAPRWQPLGLASSFVQTWPGFNDAQWRQSGAQVFLRGVLKVTTALPAGGTFAVGAPAPQLPVILTFVAGNGNSVALRIDLSTTGQLSIPTATAAGADIALDNLSYWLD